jgi:hypothetical protein
MAVGTAYRHGGRNSLQTNNKIRENYGNEKLVQILKRRIEMGKQKLIENCV